MTRHAGDSYRPGLARAPPGRSSSWLGSFDFNELPLGGRPRHRQPFLSEYFDVKGDAFADEADHFLSRFANRDASGQIRHVGAPARIPALNNHHVPRHSSAPLLFSPACFRIELKVPGGMSRLGLPPTVTVPGLLGFLNCRWLPFVRINRQPSCSSNRINSATFTPSPVSRGACLQTCLPNARASAACVPRARRLHAPVRRLTISDDAGARAYTLRSWRTRGNAVEHSFDADVLVHVRPMNPLPAANETEVGPLLRRGLTQPPRPRKRNADDPPIGEVRDDFVRCDAHALNPRIASEVRRSAHAKPPVSRRGAAAAIKTNPFPFKRPPHPDTERPQSRRPSLPQEVAAPARQLQAHVRRLGHLLIGSVGKPCRCESDVPPGVPAPAGRRWGRHSCHHPQCAAQ